MSVSATALVPSRSSTNCAATCRCSWRCRRRARSSKGEDSGLASARSKVFESLPTAGLPPQLADWTDFEAFMSTLLDSRCISSIREVWWDIRPHPDFGTVEFRMCDATPTVRAARGNRRTRPDTRDLVQFPHRRRHAAQRTSRVDRAREPVAGGPLRHRRRPDRRAPRHRAPRATIGTRPPDRPRRRTRPDGAMCSGRRPSSTTSSRCSTSARAQRVQRKVVEAGGTLVDVVHLLVDTLAADELPS